MIKKEILTLKKTAKMTLKKNSKTSSNNKKTITITKSNIREKRQKKIPPEGFISSDLLQ